MGSSPSAQQEAVMMFDSYCKTVIMNCARRYWKREAKYDAGKLSGVKPEDYAALMEEARKL